MAPRFVFGTHFFMADGVHESMRCGRLSYKERSSGSMNEQNFQAGSKALGDLILALNSPQSGPRMSEGEAP